MEHLIIGLNRHNANCLLNGEVFTLPHGIPISLTENSDIVLLFAETDDELEDDFPRRFDLFKCPSASSLDPVQPPQLSIDYPTVT